MPNPFANVGGGPGGADEGFLGLDSGNFWSRFGLPDQAAPPPISPMGPVNAMPQEQPIQPEDGQQAGYGNAGAPLDALYSMIGMSPLTADSMGRYNLTDDQRNSASRNAFADTLGTAAQVMFGTANADDMVKAGLNYGAKRDAALDRSSAINEKDYATKVDMAVKGSNLLRQQTLIEAEQEKLKEILDQKEYGAHWVETMEPVWTKYANQLAEAGDPDKAGEYAAALQMVRAKALSGDMSGATVLFDAATKQMVPGRWEEDIKEDVVRAQFKKIAELNGLAEADKALQTAMPGWKMGITNGQMVPMSPQDQAREQASIEALNAQAFHNRQVAGNYREQAAIAKAQQDEIKRITKVGDEGLNALSSAISVLKQPRTEKNATAWDKATGDFNQYVSYLEASDAIDVRNPATIQQQVAGLIAASPNKVKQLLTKGAASTSPILMSMSAVNAGANGGAASAAGATGGAGVGAGAGDPANIAAQIADLNKRISAVDPSDDQAIQELMMAISVSNPQVRAVATGQLRNRIAGKPPTNAYPPGSHGAHTQAPQGPQKAPAPPATSGEIGQLPFGNFGY